MASVEVQPDSGKVNVVVAGDLGRVGERFAGQERIGDHQVAGAET